MEGDRVRIEVVNKTDPDTLSWTYGTAVYTLVNGGSPMFMGFEEVISGSGDPIMLKKFEDLSVDTPVVSVSDGLLDLLWWWTPGAKGYNIYSSNDPYGPFTYIDFVETTWSPLCSWQTSVSGSKDFYKIVATNDLQKSNSVTIEVKEK